MNASMVSDLEYQGWVCLKGVRTTSDMLVVAKALGRPLGVRILTPVDAAEARSGSLSAAYGRGEFPFHTDTAFWPRPARYLIMRVVGDQRRPTKLLSFEQVRRGLDVRSSLDIERSVWRTRGYAGAFYCSMLLRTGSSYSWRYDVQAMMPANRAAVRARDAMETAIARSECDVNVSWSDSDCLIVDNWRMMHARGAPPPDEGSRILFRIYAE